MVFCFVQKIFLGQHESQNIYFFRRAKIARIFFQEFNIRIYDKNSESDYFFFLHQNQNIFFSNIGNQNICLEKKTITPPCKLNGRSLREGAINLCVGGIVLLPYICLFMSLNHFQMHFVCSSRRFLFLQTIYIVNTKCLPLFPSCRIGHICMIYEVGREASIYNIRL